MSFIIGSSCIGCVDTACVDVCPVDCINGPIYTDRRGDELRNMTDEEKVDKQLYINPEECILCGACIPECPVDAIYRDEDEAIEAGDEISVHKNYEFYRQVFFKKI
jgi:NAD-dependent dihydropyrimidine dehydrogenase PreA subunit